MGPSCSSFKYALLYTYEKHIFELFWNDFIKFEMSWPLNEKSQMETYILTKLYMHGGAPF